jgi:hypothetical protein
MIRDIIEGWANVVKDRFNQLDPDTKRLSEDRLLLCDSCDIRTGNTCDPRKKGEHVATGQLVGGCGCNISAKTLSTNSKCPLGKW